MYIFTFVKCYSHLFEVSINTCCNIKVNEALCVGTILVRQLTKIAQRRLKKWDILQGYNPGMKRNRVVFGDGCCYGQLIESYLSKIRCL